MLVFLGQCRHFFAGVERSRSTALSVDHAGSGSDRFARLQIRGADFRLRVRRQEVQQVQVRHLPVSAGRVKIFRKLFAGT